jgi:AraC-like DNA-binding protein
MRDADLADADGRVSRERHTLLWQEVTRELGDEQLGFHYAQTGVDDSSLGIVGLLARARETAAAAIEAAVYYWPLVDEDTIATFAVEGNRGTLRWGPSGTKAPWCPAMEDAVVAACVVLARRWTGANVRPIDVRCRRPSPRDPSWSEAFLGCPITFGDDVTAIVFSRDVLDLPLRTRQAEVLPYLDDSAEWLLERIRSGPVIEERVRRAIGRVGADLDRIAHSLGMKRRTMQRRLRDRGVLFEDLVEKHRRDLVRRLLDDRSLSKSQIARAAGFSDVRSLRRALARWGRSSQ